MIPPLGSPRIRSPVHGLPLVSPELHENSE